MRRKDREVTDQDQITEILDTCKVLRMAVSDEKGLYIVPLNYGYEYQNGHEIVFYMHCAKEGRKLDAIATDPKIAFELDCCHELIEGKTACYYGYRYKSIIGNGIASIVESSRDKKHALQLIMKQQTDKNTFVFDDEMVNSVTVIKISVKDFAAKWHK